jgi:hypothetical protein
MKAIRRIAVALAVLVTVLLVAVIGLRLHGRHRLEQTEALFVRELGPLPEVPPGTTVDDWRQKLNEDSQEGLDMFRRVREAGDAAMGSLETGDRQAAMERLQEMERLRDDLLNQPALVSQILGTSAGSKAIEVIKAFLQLPNLQPDELKALASALEEPSDAGWRGALAHEAVLSQLWSKEDLPGAGVLGEFVLRLQMPYTVAANMGVYLGMYQSVRDHVEDVNGHIRQTYQEAGAVPWMYPIAEILIPNLVAIAEKRRDYLIELDELRSRLPKPGETSSGP